MLVKRVGLVITVLTLAALSISASPNTQAKETNSNKVASPVTVTTPDPVTAMTAHAMHAWNYQQWILHEDLERLAYLEAVHAEEVVRQAASRAVSRVTSSNSNPGDFLSCVRARESGGNYSIYNTGGSGAAGAYQFMPSTWNSTANSAGRPDLVGVSPADASPADQDAMAQHLYATSGSSPWGGYCG